MNLKELRKGQKAQIVGFEESLGLNYRTRLQDLGFSLNEVVCCQKNIPFGGPSVYMVNQTVFSLEAEVAQKVLVKKVCSS